MAVAGNTQWWLGHAWLRNATCQPLFGRWLWLVRQATRGLTIVRGSRSYFCEDRPLTTPVEFERSL
ncbi:hypothetical protein PENSUB_1872 [Penicillium subrubescens]|uniref:Uncharacterized protein n=1 Tax=Penicillium subrubescens TaxID=1316194 RepID=A0A1Q5UJ48_9EURO|nr:hypothetical protein PENSUB_1872 [Penicillium subrubescens]